MEKLTNHCTLYWWNMGTKTLAFKGTLGELLEKNKIQYLKRKTMTQGINTYHFKNQHGLSFKTTGVDWQLPDIAKQFLQMELVRMGDKATLHVEGVIWRPKVTVNH